MIARLLISKNFQPTGVDTNHPDVLYFKKGEKLGIAQAKKIKEHFATKPYSAKGKTVVIEDASVMTDECQNALLKTFEELPKEAMIILGAVSEANLLPTILSRCQITRIPASRQGGQNSEFRVQNYKEEIEKLLSASIEERFKYIEKLKDREEFLHAMIQYFRNQMFQISSDRGINETIKDYLKELLQAERWAKQNVNIRAILEYLMLSMPSKL